MHFIIIAFIALFGGCLYFALPFYIQIIVLAINAVTPDCIPFVDEIIMVGGILSKLNSLGKVIYFVSEHKFLSIIISIFLIWGGIQILSWIF